MLDIKILITLMQIVTVGIVVSGIFVYTRNIAYIKMQMTMINKYIWKRSYSNGVMQKYLLITME